MTTPRSSGDIKIAEPFEVLRTRYRQAREEFRDVIEQKIRVLENERREFEQEIQRKITLLREEMEETLTSDMSGRLLVLQFPEIPQKGLKRGLTKTLGVTAEKILAVLTPDRWDTYTEISNRSGLPAHSVGASLSQLAREQPPRVRRRKRGGQKNPYEYSLVHREE